MTREWTLWVVAAATALHAAEEYLTGWLDWAPWLLGIDLPGWIFLVMNLVLLVAAVAGARAGWRRPVASLVIPAATLINAVCFHILPTVVQGELSPGVFTSVALYLPFSSWALVGAARDGVPRRAIALGIGLGAVLMLTVVVGARWLTEAPSRP